METIKIEFTKQDINNLLALIAKAPITGNDAVVVVQLQQKLLTALPVDKETVTSTEEK